MTWHEPEKNQLGKSKRHNEVAQKTALSTTLRTSLQPKKVFDISKIEKIVDKYVLEYQNKFGLGACAPVAQIILDDIRQGSLSGILKSGEDYHNWRIGYVEYKNKHPHYVVVHIDNKQKPDLIIDATNYFDDDKTRVRLILKGGSEWNNYVNEEFEFFKDGEDVMSVCDIYNKEDIDFWRSVWK